NFGTTTSNTVGSTSNPTSIQNAGNGATTGISITTGATTGSLVSGNTVSGITATPISGTPAITGITVTATTTSTISVQGNTVRDMTVNGAVASTFAGISTGSGTISIGTATGYTINNITYGGTSTVYGISTSS